MKNLLFVFLIILMIGCTNNSSNKNYVPTFEGSAVVSTTGIVPPVVVSTIGPIPPPVIVSTMGVSHDTTKIVITGNARQDALLLFDYFKTFGRNDVVYESYKQEDSCGPVFEQKTGYCGSRCLAFNCRYQKWGYTSRYIAMWGLNTGGSCYANHALVECWWDEKWHLIDPTYLLYFTLGNSDDILSMEEILANKYSKDLRVVGDTWHPGEVLGFIQSHYAITYGWDEYLEIVKFLSRQ
jgi:hypothetical protein